MTKFGISYIIFILLIQNIYADSFKIKYFDGSGNGYIISKNKISYIPVKKKFSSSGNYSGGEEKDRKISIKDYNNLYSIIIIILNKKEIHLENRIMTSGMIIFYNKKNELSRCIISPMAAEKIFLEKKLKELIK